MSELKLSTDLLSEEFLTDASAVTENLMLVASNDNVLFGERQNAIMSAMISLFPLLLHELNTDPLTYKKSEQATRICTHLEKLQNALYKKRESENKVDVDLNHPKFQNALDFIVEGFLDVMNSEGIDSSTKDRIVQSFGQKMVGFEDDMNKRLKGVAFSKLDRIENPLITSFNDKRSNRAHIR